MGDQKMQLVDWLDDLCVRFIINLPQEELESVARICFQVEEAQWYYEDFVRPTDPSLPSLNLREFCLKIFQHCPLLSTFSDAQHQAAYQEFLGYKTRVPVRGGILLNHDMTEVLLVKGWKKGASWSFPRGKINKDEKDLDCAVREVYEETGYDIHAAGLYTDPDQVKAIDVTMREQHMRLFVFRNVPMDTHFEPRTRKEISKIDWYKLASLPFYGRKNKQSAQEKHEAMTAGSKFYMVAPFLGPLNKWIAQQRRLDLENAYLREYDDVQTDTMAEETDDGAARAPEASRAEEAAAIDPAAELKRLLSVGFSGQVPPVTVEPEPAPSANDLLAMLRGNHQSSQRLQAPATNLPRTSLDQITGFPSEPQSPHYHHQHPSPDSRRQPPPQFPIHLMADQTQWQSSRGIDPVAPYLDQHRQQMQGNASRDFQHFGQPPSGPFQAGPPGHNAPNGPHVPPQMSTEWQSPSSRQQQAMPWNSQWPQTTQPLQTQGPVPPKASQLPPPRLNAHSMSLLNAFKTNPNGPQPDPRIFNGSHPALQSPLNLPQPQRNDHQNSLLGLFRNSAASTPKAAPDVSNTLGPSAPEVANVEPVAPPAPQQPGGRRPSGMNMITRTLPKVRVEEQKPTAPVPSLAMASAMQPSVPNAHPNTSVRHKVRSNEQRSPRSEVAAEPLQPGTIKILSRPGSSASKAMSSPQSPARRAPTPSQASTTAKIENKPPHPISILRNPATTRTVTRSGTTKADAPLSAAKDKVEKPVQPQLLRRPQPEESAQANPPAELSGDTAPPKLAQRDALLALFAKPATASAPQAASQPSGNVGPAKVPHDVEYPNLPLGSSFGTRSSNTRSPAPTQGVAAWNMFSSPSNGQLDGMQSDGPRHNIAGSAETQQAWAETFKQTEPINDWQGGPRAVKAFEQTLRQGSGSSRVSTPSAPPTNALPGDVDAKLFAALNGPNPIGARRTSERPKSPETPLEAKDFLVGFLDGIVKREQKKGA